MGDISEMILDGWQCSECGTVFEKANGHLVLCAACYYDYKYDGENPPYPLAKYEDMPVVCFDLHNADPNCEHEIEEQDSGIKCKKCTGWFCF